MKNIPWAHAACILQGKWLSELLFLPIDNFKPKRRFYVKRIRDEQKKARILVARQKGGVI